MRRPLRTLQNLLEALPFFFLVAIAQLLPRRAALRFGRVLGRLGRLLQPARRHTARDNLRQAFPQQSADWIEYQLSSMFEHLGISAMELLRLASARGRTALQSQLHFSGLEQLQQLREHKQGAFLLTAHLGFWEVGPLFLPPQGLQVSFVAKAIRNPYIDRFFWRLRTSGGGQGIDSRHAARRIVRALGQGQLVGLLLDQHVSKKTGVVVNFFGRPAYTTPIITQIALKTGTPVVTAFAYRQPDFSYRVLIQPPLYLEGDCSDTNIQQQTQRLTAIMEEAIRQQPQQWFWLHRRWRWRPEQGNPPPATPESTDSRSDP
ncbi:lysophospholipid acyltransferase family protein [Desulfuromonas thiophila]|uniref:KDO2-lipid IV(A) lauroyltransferase n=1 Tax=Desulfuromonas thiophila TaxID=57664 RepID=A0A1G7ANB1_9BACT|nr:lysophospholipid acyltransferase family protein [Desulfuromonas thiophila]SDE15366.1 KDO2-lipid IV(A) lauroyltransferase [Desulfuromonas thiophila]